MKFEKHLRCALVFCLILFAYYAKCQINFTSSNLSNLPIANPTSIQFGPDGRLYIAQQDGTIKIVKIQKLASNNYKVIATESIFLVKTIPNHYDDGTPKPFNSGSNKRQVTGLYVAGTSTNPIIYVSSSDNTVGGGSTGDANLCTNSGIISKLTLSGTTWSKMDLVRGLPRSEENHSPNGIQYDAIANKLYLAVGGFTNAGSPSKLFAYISEYALSGTILVIDLNTIEALPTLGASTANPYKYDIPTLDDPTRSNNPDGSDINDPFGGNNGLNQAKIVAGGPVQIYATGFRNPYDIVITKTPGKAGRMYTIDNGANENWGGYPANEGPQGTATNNYVPGEPGSTTPSGTDGKVNNLDGVHKIDMTNYVIGSYYGGHPCPTRCNPSGAGLYTYSGTLTNGTGVWRTSKTDPLYPLPADWPPLPLNKANPIEGDFQNPGVTNQALLTFNNSTNGICEYTASNFNGALKGDLFAISFTGELNRIRIAPDGSVLNSKGSSKLNQDPTFASGFGNQGLDVTAQGDSDIFPGTIWVANYAGDSITVFEPKSITCAGTYSTTLDEDGDGYKNADEIDNNTNPCSAASVPPDNDKDFISDLNDPDDDNDGIADTSDPFAIDKFNGTTTNIPITLSLFNNDPGTGFFGLGLTGLMTNKSSNYQSLFNKDNLVAGGAIGAFTINAVPNGDALNTLNTQQNAFQFGVNVNSNTGPFTVRTVMLASFFNSNTPTNYQSEGLYIGNGDQDNYLKVTLNANSGKGGIEVVHENSGVATSTQYAISAIPISSAELQIQVNPATGKAQIRVSLDGSTITNLGGPITLSGKILQSVQGTNALAIGIISTSRGSTPFNATWDLIEVTKDPIGSKGNWEFVTSSDASLPIARNEAAFTQCGDKFYLIGGRGVINGNEFDPSNKTWKIKSKPPIELHHFEAVSIDNLIYIVSAFTGVYPYETPVANIYIYDPATDKWITGPVIPQARRRGSAGTVVYNKKIYIAAGIINGHVDGWVKWFDEFDPATNQWRILPDAPRERDHFHAAINQGKLYLAGGRRTSYATNEVFKLTIPQVDIYDFTTNTWSTNANNIPTQRAGCTAVTLNDEVIVIGGESDAQTQAHNQVEALNVTTGQWRSLDTLNIGRNGTQAFVSNQDIYICAGSKTKGGNSTTILNSTEEFYFQSKSLPTGQPITRSGITAGSTFSLGMVSSGSSKTDSVPYVNANGNQGIMITDIRIKNNPSNFFSIVSNSTPPFFIAPNVTNKIAVKFTPTNGNPTSAILVIKHTGKGDSTLITLSGNTSQTNSATVSPTSISFTETILNTTISQQVTVQNTGQSPITITGLTFTGTNTNQFAHNFTAQSILQAGTSKSYTISFTPTSEGQKTATLNITIAELANPLTVPLSGLGVTSGSSSISLINPVDGSNFTSGASVDLQAIVNISGTTDTYLKINCPDATFRKLKIGTTTGLYSSKVNVTSGGNTTVEIIFRDPNNNINWSKIQIRPNGVLTSPVIIGNYINNAQSLNNGFKKITIPISSFSGIDFTQISNIEFPYSTGAGVFEFHLQSLVFTGGSTPYTWFGPSKTNVVNDGLGGGGQLTATLVQGSITTNSVSFYQNNQLLFNDINPPYEYNWTNLAKGNYTLTAKAFFSDNSTANSNIVVINVTDTTTTSGCMASGTILREYWNGVQGNLVSNIPVNLPPTSTGQVLLFEGPSNAGTNYGTRYRGYICVPTTGNYFFWISSNDESELWLSTDNNPANRKKIAYVQGYTGIRQWDKYPYQKSVAISLVAGQSYYIEALHKQGVGTDNLAVGWQLPDGTQERPIPGSRLSPYSGSSSLAKIEAIKLNVVSDTRSNDSIDVTLFPNPTQKGQITLAIEGYDKTKHKVSINIVNQMGSLVYSNKVSCEISCRRTIINIDDNFKPGTYIVNVTIDKTTYSERLIVE